MVGTMEEWIRGATQVVTALVAMAALIVSVRASRRFARRREFEILLERIDQEAAKREKRIDQEAAKREKRIDQEAAKREKQFEREAAKRERQFEREAAKREEAIRAQMDRSDRKFEALLARSDELFRHWRKRPGGFCAPRPSWRRCRLGGSARQCNRPLRPARPRWWQRREFLAAALPNEK